MNTKTFIFVTTLCCGSLLMATRTDGIAGPIQGLKRSYRSAERDSGAFGHFITRPWNVAALGLGLLTVAVGHGRPDLAAYGAGGMLYLTTLGLQNALFKDVRNHPNDKLNRGALGVTRLVTFPLVGSYMVAKESLKGVALGIGATAQHGYSDVMKPVYQNVVKPPAVLIGSSVKSAGSATLKAAGNGLSKVGTP